MAANVLHQILRAARLPGSLPGSQRAFQALQEQAALQQPQAQGQAALQPLLLLWLLQLPQLLQLLQLLAMLRLLSNLRKQPECVMLASAFLFQTACSMTFLMLRAIKLEDSDGGETRT